MNRQQEKSAAIQNSIVSNSQPLCDCGAPLFNAVDKECNICYSDRVDPFDDHDCFNDKYDFDDDFDKDDFGDFDRDDFSYLYDEW